MLKKGALETPIYYGVVALSLGFLIIFLSIVIDNFNTGIQNTNSTMIQQEVKDASTVYTTSIHGMDIAFAVLFLGFLIGSIWYARVAEELNPMWIFAFLIAMVVFGFFGMILENIYNAFTEQSLISSTVSNFPFMNFFLDNFVVLLIVYVAIVGVVWLTRERGGAV